MLRFALLSLYSTRLWVPFIGLGGFGQYTVCSVVCYTVIPLLCGQCTDIRKVSLRQCFAYFDVADVIAFAIESRFYFVQFFLCTKFTRLFATVYRVFCKIHSYIGLNMIVKLRMFRWLNLLSYLMHRYVA